MAESNDVQSLKKICTEVVETHYKVVLSSQSIKAQDYLVDKLRKQSEQQKQVYNSISNGNLKLETEIKTAEQQVQRLQHAVDTIKEANVELKKELLLSKERKVSVIERVNNGIKKYNEIWRVSKQRCESIPLIQNYLQAKEKNKTLEESILNLTNEAQKLRNDIKIRTVLDRKNIIELANFMIHERPQMLQIIQEKNWEVVKLLNDIKNITKEDNTVSNKTATSAPTGMDTHIEDSWPNLTTDNAMVMTKLQLRSDEDFDSISNKLDQIIKKADSQSALKRTENQVGHLEDQVKTNEVKNTMNNRNVIDKTQKDIPVSGFLFTHDPQGITDSLNYSSSMTGPSYFNSPKKSADETGPNECAHKIPEKKLMHILEDIKLDSVETYNIVSNVKPSSLKHVDVINPAVQKEPINSKKCDQEKRIQEKNCEVVKLLSDIKNIPKEDNTVSNKTATSAPTGMDIHIEDSWPNLTTDNAMVMPKIQLRSDEELDSFSNKLDQIKKADSQSALKRTEKRERTETLALDLTLPTKKFKSDETVRDVYVPSYFNSPKTSANDTGPNECHGKISEKLIHTQEDIKLDNVETYNIVSNVKPSSLEHEDVINPDVQKEPINSKKCDQEKMPKIQLRSDEELDSFPIKLDQIKKVDSQSAFKRTEKIERTETLALDLTLPTKKIRSDETEEPINVQKEPINLKKCDQEKVIDKTQKDILVSGFLFTHGPQGITDSLNYSSSTTGFEDTDADYPHCIDSNLLLSPKADIELPTTSNNNNQ